MTRYPRPPTSRVSSPLTSGRLLRACARAFAAALLTLFALSGAGARAAVDVQLSPSADAPQPVGTTVVWTASAADTNAGALEYRFTVRSPDGDFAVVRDFDPAASFEWTPGEREGTYNVRVTVKNTTTLEEAQLETSYDVSSRVTGSDPVISATANPLVALYSAPACDAGSMRVRFWRTGELSSQVTSWKSCVPGVSMNFYVAGMLVNTQYSLQHEVSSDPALPPATGPTLSFTTGAPTAGYFPAASVITPPAGDSAQALLLHAYLGSGTPAPPLFSATDLSGRLLWYYDEPILHATSPCEGGAMLVLASVREFEDTLRKIDLAGGTLRETNITALSEQLNALGAQSITHVHHDARCLPDGRTVVLANNEQTLSDVQGPGPVTIMGDVLIVLDRDWKVIWSWNSFDHLDVTRAAVFDYKLGAPYAVTAPVVNDWLHSNAVTYSPADGNLLLSMRHQDWVIKIDYRDGDGTGAVVWRLGKGGDFTTDSADPYPWFSHQHDAGYEPGSSENITLFDNGNTRLSFPNLTTNSRGQVYKLDETAHTATLLLNANLGAFSNAWGSAQKLADGNYHFMAGRHSGNIGRSIEVSPAGALTYILQSQPATYRSFRMRDLYTLGDSTSANGDEQTITFDAVADKSYGDSPFNVVASASSGLPVTLRVVSGPATISGDAVTITGTGTVVLQAEQYGNIKYDRAASVRRSFNVGKASQTITFDALANKSFGDADFQLSATASSGLSVSFGAVGRCTVNGATVHLTGAGTCTITASQGGDSNFNAAAPVERSFTIAEGPQTIQIQLSPSAGAPQPVGTTIVWTVSAADTYAGALEYQFSVQSPGAGFAVVRDFDPAASFEWTPGEREGTYNVRVTVKNTTTNVDARLEAGYSVSSRVSGDDPVISATSNPLVVLYSAPACDAGGMRVRFWKAGDFSSQSTPWKSCVPGVSMNFYVAGMLASTQYNLRHEVSSDPALPLTAGPTLPFTTGAAPADLPATSVINASAGDTGQDVLLHSYLKLPSNSAAPFFSATNLGGQLLWYYGRRISYAMRPLEGGTMLVLPDSPTLREIDLAGNTVRETNTKAVSDQLLALGKHDITAFHHEAGRLPDGKTVVLASTERVLSDVQGPGPVTIVGDMVIVLDSDLQATWAWDSFDHLDVTRKALLDEKCPQLCFTTAATANDWTHSNAVTYSPADGNLLVSVRHQDWVVKLDYRDGQGTGAVVWRLGKDGDFTTDSADPYPWFSHQHDVSYEPGETQKLTVYDNGNTRQSFPNATANSRGQVWQIDETAHTATLQLNADLGGYSSALGSAQKLGNGSYHFLSGLLSPTQARSIEVSPAGALTFTLQSQAATYRSFRMRDMYTPRGSGPADGDEQTITFDAVADKSYGDSPFNVVASASSGLPVTLRVVSGPATISGDTVTVNGVGVVVLQADQYGNIKYRQAASVRRSFSVGKASQTITFDALTGKTFGDADFQLTATASSGLTVGLSAAPAGKCTLTGVGVHIVGAGTCTITASQGGDDNYNAATAVQRSFQIAKAASTTTVTVADSVYDGLPHGAAAAVTGAGGLSQTLPVTYAGRNETAYGPSTNAPTNAGDYKASASFGGDNHADSADGKDFKITKAAQTITFAALTNKTFGDADFNVGATSSVGLSVSFNAAGKCAVTGAAVHLTGAGLCIITAVQPGDGNYNAASDAPQSFQIAKGSTTTSLSSSALVSPAGQNVTLTAVVASAAGRPTGSVQFKSDGASLGAPVALDAAGAAVLTTSALDAGSHALAAEYNGDSDFDKSGGALGGNLVVGSLFEFSKGLYSVAERAASVSINVRRTGDTSRAASVNYSTEGGAGAGATCSATTGLALERCDYAPAGGTLRFAAGEAEKSFTVLLSDDSYNEGTETAQVRLWNASDGAALGAQAVSTLSIEDDASESSANPIDDDGNFVRQHYADFLNREADAEGLAFWTSQMRNCGSTNPEVCRVNVSAAFFLSIEFQQTGFLVERMYKAAYGDATGTSTLGGAHTLAVPAVRFSEFMPDTQQIGRGVIVGQGNWQQRLEANKTAFALEFVRRPAFLARYPAGMHPTDFVNLLDSNAGGVLSLEEKAALVAELTPDFGDAALRASVLRKVAEDADLAGREYNRAFVLMQYFGYLRRNPNDAPEAGLNHTGYDFWLRKLEEFGGDAVAAEMVKAFLAADEYRQRFGH